jgi:hypothetical protein
MQLTNFYKLNIKVILCCSLLLSSGTITAGSKVDLSLSTTYTGIVTALSTVDIYGGFDNEFKGLITYTPLPGTLFKGPILDLKGKTIRQGSILIKMDTTYRDAQVKQAAAAVAKDNAALDSLKTKYGRYIKIHEAKKGAISEQDYLEAKNNYLQAVAQLEADKAALILAKKLRTICTYYARFDGIVDEVSFPGGYIGNFGVSPTLKVSQLVPIAINIKMSREEAAAVNITTPISVYPIDSNKTLGVYRGHGRLLKDGLQIILTNYITTPETKKLSNGKVVPVISHISSVVPFNLEDDLDYIGINKECIGKDAKGVFVYKVKEQKTAQPGKGLNHEMNIEKVYVTLGNEVNPIEPSVQYVSLKNKGSLKANDIIINTSEFSKLKNSSTVYYSMKRYLFMPGDPVRVVIGGPSK